MNKMIIHYCGGAGINVSKVINKELSELGDGFCTVDHHYLDTSTNNINGLDSKYLWKIDSNNFDNTGISGSGGERRENSSAIIASISEYLDNFHYTKEVIGEFHVVVFSGSGGTGSVISPVLISNLRTRNIPVLGIMIGDSSNGLNCKNTLNTIATLDHMAKVSLKKPIIVLYYNNHDTVGKDVISKESTVNRNIYDSLAIMSMFISGANEDIDTKDMVNFLSPDQYTTISIKPSLYTICIYTEGVVNNNTDCINILGRTLSKPKDTPNLNLTLLQHKYGTVTSENAVKIIGKITPIHIILTGNELVQEHIKLKNTVEEYESIMNSITTSTLDGVYEATDDGLIL